MASRTTCPPPRPIEESPFLEGVVGDSIFSAVGILVGITGGSSVKTQPSGGAIKTMLPHLGHSRISPIASLFRTASRARHVVQDTENSAFSTVRLIPPGQTISLERRSAVRHCVVNCTAQDDACHVTEIYEAERMQIVAVLTAPGSKARTDMEQWRSVSSNRLESCAGESHSPTRRSSRPAT